MEHDQVVKYVVYKSHTIFKNCAVHTVNPPLNKSFFDFSALSLEKAGVLIAEIISILKASKISQKMIQRIQ